jgi:hypothetical protein
LVSEMKNYQHNLVICIVKEGITTKKGGLLFKELLLPRAVPGRPSSYYVGAEFCDRVDCSVVIIDFHVFPSYIQCANCHLIIGSYYSYQVDSEFI